jgi:hypothetical protein
MNEFYDDTIHRELSPNEKLLWTGRPEQGVKVRAGDALMIPFSIMWGGFAIFWEINVLNSKAPVFFALWGIPFVGVGLYLIFGRFWFDSLQRSKTIYAVTAERVIIISGVFSQNTKSLNIDTLSDVSLTEHRDGTGTISFGSLPPWYWWTRGTAWPGYTNKLVPCFELIDEPRNVFDMIRNTQRAARKVPS